MPGLPVGLMKTLPSGDAILEITARRKVVEKG
jgi:hypothetical protein